MKLLRKTGIVLLAFVMLLSLGGGAFAEGTGGADAGDPVLPENSAALTLLDATGIMQGDETGNLMLESSVTRAEMAKILVVATNNKPDGTAAVSFSDCEGHWAADYIAAAVKLGIVNGHGDGTFTPDRTVTCTEAAAMILRAIGYCGSEMTGANWISGVSNVANVAGAGGLLTISDKSMVRNDVASALYVALFIGRAATAEDGSYTPVTDASGKALTLADGIGIKLNITTTSDGYKVSITVNGVFVGGVYSVPNGTTPIIPAANAVAEASDNTVFYVLANAGGADSNKVRLVNRDGSVVTETVSNSFSDRLALVGRFVEIRGGTLSELKSAEGEGSIAGKSGKLPNGMDVGLSATFLLYYEWGSASHATRVAAKNCPTIIAARYRVYTAASGAKFVYVGNAQNSSNFSGTGQVFLVNPVSYSRQSVVDIPEFISTYGTVNGEAGKVYLNSNMVGYMTTQGLYKGVVFTDGLINDSELLTKRVNQLDPADATGDPLRGISYTDGVVHIGINPASEKKFSYCMSDDNSKIFHFYMNADGSYSSKYGTIDMLKEDLDAYVWGTISEGQILNLYVVHSTSND